MAFFWQIIIIYVIKCVFLIVVEHRLNRSEDAFQELNRKSATLKKILSRIPDEITDRKTFLEIIKYVIITYNTSAFL